MQTEKYELTEETAKVVSLAPGAPPVFESRKYGTIDIRTLTPERAKQLVEEGIPDLVAIQAPTVVAPPVKLDAKAAE